jgi:hypothetical protein
MVIAPVLVVYKGIEQAPCQFPDTAPCFFKRIPRLCLKNITIQGVNGVCLADEGCFTPATMA